MKENKIEKLVWSIFLAIGVIFLLVGIVICAHRFNYENKVDTTGVITEISYHRHGRRNSSHDVYVLYNVDGKQYESKLNSYASSFYVGKEIPIYYDQKNPNKIGVKSLDLLFLIFPVIGLMFAITGGSGMAVIASKRRNMKKLQETGRVVYANYAETVVNTFYSVNGRHPYNVICEWIDPMENKKYRFKSKNIWFNPEQMIAEKDLQYFRVHIDEKNKKKYVIDTEVLNEDIRRT